jgi:predicted metal-binding membrane protein
MMRSIGLTGLTRPPWPLLFGIAATGQVLAQALSDHSVLSFFCGGTGWFVVADPLDAVVFILRVVGPFALAVGWLVMLGVMMPPVLGWPIMHIWRSSLPARRPRALGGFLISYAAIWLLVGPPMVIAAILMRLSLSEGLGPASAVILGALCWSASPWQRMALNRGHRLKRIGLRGWKADRDSIRFGASHGGWCVMSCWPWMLAPMVAGTWHAPAMAVATLAMFVERLASPGRPRWRRPTLCVLIVTLFKPRPVIPGQELRVRHG